MNPLTSTMSNGQSAVTLAPAAAHEISRTASTSEEQLWNGLRVAIVRDNPLTAKRPWSRFLLLHELAHVSSEGVALQVFGWVPLITGVAGWCPFYAVLGLSTRRRRVVAATLAGGLRSQATEAMLSILQEVSADYLANNQPPLALAS